MALTGSGTAKYQAQNILCFFYDECDPFYFSVIESRSPESTIEIDNNYIQNEFSIYPNPAGNWVMIELTQQTYDNLENVEIIITDVTGKLIHQTSLLRNTYLWETGAIQNGIYLIVVKSDDMVFKTEKVIINR